MNIVTSPNQEIAAPACRQSFLTEYTSSCIVESDIGDIY